MKKQYIAAAACLVAGTIGFAAVYSTQLSTDDEIPTEISQTASIVKPKEKTPKASTEKVAETEKENSTEKSKSESENGEDTQNQQTPEIKQPQEEQYHFSESTISTWPCKGDVILPFSMDKTIYFPTLDQYQYNRGIVIKADKGKEVLAAASGKVKDVYTCEETGTTLVEELGDGYTLTYGQLEDVKFSVGDKIEAGNIIGIVAEPSRYYKVEGSNIYLELKQDDTPVDPMNYLGKIQ